MFNKLKHPSVGIDAEQISRFKKKKIADPFLKRIFTSVELHYCFGGGSPAEHLAGRFAAKEAVRKALTPFTKRPFDYREVEIKNDKFGSPEVFLLGDRKNKFYISVSISHTSDLAIAAAIAALS